MPSTEPRNRSAGIVVKDGKILLIRRVNDGEKYYVFPGGGVEAGETPEQAVIREVFEECSIKVTCGQLLYRVSWDIPGINYFYLCNYVEGEPALQPDSVEVEQMKKGKQFFEPVWFDISELGKIILYQLEIRDLVIDALRNGFDSKPKELFIRFADRRQK